MKILNLTLGGDISNHLFIDIYKYEMAVPRDSQVFVQCTFYFKHLFHFQGFIFCYRSMPLSWIQNVTIFSKHSSIKQYLTFRYVIIDNITTCIPNDFS